MTRAFRTGLVCCAVGLLVMVGFAATGHAMSKYIWKNRPLLVFAPNASDALLARQKRIVAASRSGFAERDMVIIYVVGSRISTALGASPGMTAGALRRRYGVASGSFRSLLVGKDGGVKLSSHQAIGAGSLFSLIDRMPMRRQEMRSRAR